MPSFCVEQSAGLVKSSGATVAAAGGTSVVSAVSLARSLNMAGIIVSQTIAGQTIATINKGQTVVAPASFLQVNLLTQLRVAISHRQFISYISFSVL